MNGGEEAAPGGNAAWRRWIPVLLLAIGLAAVFLFDLDRFLSFEALRGHRAWLTAEVAAHPIRSAALFFAVYVAATALSVPGGAVLTLAGGFLFGTLGGTLLVLGAATLGACIVFLAARTALGDLLRRRAGPFLKRMEKGFRSDGFHYLLVLRLVPLFPFWLVNLVPAFFGMRLRSYALATLIGIAPATIVFSSLGGGLGSVFDAGATPDLGLLFTPRLMLPILGLALLALVPVLYRRLARRSPRGNGPRS
ncbi:MAG: VTT domain-containing protein [Rhodospirillales bacterium]|nr:VTT domain-containing protein [Rhodospirillales bacterium]